MLTRLASIVLGFGSGFMAATLITNPASGYAAVHAIAVAVFAGGSVAIVAWR